MAAQKDRRTVVPWFSMAEWEITYQNIYSGDAELQLRGYERLLVWKARCPRLPIGVECTMGMLQVQIKDQHYARQISSGVMHPYQEYDQRLLYSTSVMRFLNQIAVLAQSSSETLYQAARKMYIPDWLVALRHDTAHGTSLPPLALLRKAAHFALTWLHEYYWKGEAAASADCVSTDADRDPNNKFEELKQLLEMWQALKLYSLSDYKYLDEIPDTHLRKYLKRITSTNTKRNKKSTESRVITAEDNEICRTENEINKNHCTTNTEEPISLESAVSRVKGKLLAKIKKNKHSPIICEKIVEQLLNGHVFLPSAGIWDMFKKDLEGEKDSLAPWVIEFWSPMLNSLQEHLNSLPTLLHHLVSAVTSAQLGEHQHWVAALWIKELCAACAKARFVHQTAYSDLSISPGTKIPKDIWKTAEKIMIKRKPEFRRVITLKISDSCQLLSVDDIRKILLSPSKWTHIFLTEMLVLVNFPDAVRRNLVCLVSIYTQDLFVNDVDPEEDTTEEQVHTVSELVEQMPETEREVTLELPIVETEEENPTKDISINWKRSLESHNWTKCPLGVLPWQRGRPTLQLNFDSDVSWQSLRLQEPEEAENCDKSDLPTQIPWEKVLKKKIKRGRVTKRKKKMNNVLKNAFQMVYSAS